MASYSIPNMNCGGCVRGVTNAIRAIDDQAVVVADLPAKTITVDSLRDASAIVGALKSAGFEAAAVA